MTSLPYRCDLRRKSVREDWPEVHCKETLFGLFGQAGKVVDGFIMPAETSWNHTYGFVKYATAEEAIIATKMFKGHSIKDKTITTELSSKTRTKTETAKTASVNKARNVQVEGDKGRGGIGKSTIGIQSRTRQIKGSMISRHCPSSKYETTEQQEERVTDKLIRGLTALKYDDWLRANMEIAGVDNLKAFLNTMIGVLSGLSNIPQGVCTDPHPGQEDSITIDELFQVTEPSSAKYPNASHEFEDDESVSSHFDYFKVERKTNCEHVSNDNNSSTKPKTLFKTKKPIVPEVLNECRSKKSSDGGEQIEKKQNACSLHRVKSRDGKKTHVDTCEVPGFPYVCNSATKKRYALVDDVSGQKQRLLGILDHSSRKDIDKANYSNASENQRKLGSSFDDKLNGFCNRVTEIGTQISGNTDTLSDFVRNSLQNTNEKLKEKDLSLDGEFKGHCMKESMVTPALSSSGSIGVMSSLPTTFPSSRKEENRGFPFLERSSVKKRFHLNCAEDRPRSQVLTDRYVPLKNYRGENISLALADKEVKQESIDNTPYRNILEPLSSSIGQDARTQGTGLLVVKALDDQTLINEPSDVRTQGDGTPNAKTICSKTLDTRLPISKISSDRTPGAGTPGSIECFDTIDSKDTKVMLHRLKEKNKRIRENLGSNHKKNYETDKAYQEALENYEGRKLRRLTRLKKAMLNDDAMQEDDIDKALADLKEENLLDELSVEIQESLRLNGLKM